MTYPGGKAGSGVYQKIINQISPHRVYIEPFLGHGSVMLHKLPAACTIGIDSDAHVVQHWMDLIANNDDAHDRLLGSCTVKHGDAISFLQSYDFHGDEFVYADPPYLFETRRSKRKLYNVEFGDVDQHEKLLAVLKSLPCMVAISGYQSSLYSAVLAKWRTISYNTVNRAGDVVEEWLWMNYDEPTELHDYRYLGENFREREKITRQKRRWRARLARMEPLQRYALMASIAEFSDTAVTPE
jgi:site-specific DNA-adenine methylase